VCEWRDRGSLFVRLEREVRRDLAAGRLPPVQPFHIMAYPFPADLAKVSRLCVEGFRAVRVLQFVALSGAVVTVVAGLCD
jgi:hypothetical protein